MASAAVHNAFYVDDGLCGADSVDEALVLQSQLQEMFKKGGFFLRKWKCSEPNLLQHLPSHLLDLRSSQEISETEGFDKTLGLEWSASIDCFRLTIAPLPPTEVLTKRSLVSNIAKTFDVLGWFSPSIIKLKIFLQRLWEEKVGWDEPIPNGIRDEWERWRSELNVLSNKLIRRCYFPKDVHVSSKQLLGFCDASEEAYAAVVYVRMEDTHGNAYVSLVSSKTKVAPIRRLTVPRLELCGANLLANLLHHLREVLGVSSNDVFAWTDSKVVLGWLAGNPRRF